MSSKPIWLLSPAKTGEQAAIVKIATRRRFGRCPHFGNVGRQVPDAM